MFGTLGGWILRGGEAVISYIRSRLWPVPVVLATVLVIAAELLSQVHVPAGSATERWLWPGESSAAESMLSLLAGSSLTVISLTMSMTLVVLQLASANSPRLLREFTSDFSTQLLLGGFFGLFGYCLVVLRNLPPDPPGHVPALAVGIAPLLALLVVGGLIAFIAYLVQLLRIDLVMSEVRNEGSRVLRAVYGPVESPFPRGDAPPTAGGVPMRAQKAGYVQFIDLDELFRSLRSTGYTVVVDVRPGDRIRPGHPLGRVVCEHEDGPGDVSDRLTDMFVIGDERTMDQDVSFAVRQLADVAVKALSPGVNDPTTATHALDFLGDLLSQRARYPDGHQRLVHGDGSELYLRGYDLDELLLLSTDQILRYGGAEPAVLSAILSVSRDLAAHTVPDQRRHEAVQQLIDRVSWTIGRHIPDPVAADRVRDEVDTTRVALRTV
ncbi:DUF2254 domain-containing protein [Lipingzhangella sp. LS1_29]|uniref:DUF2254 domain-containing protein n=1 Tax=Lipingzhangella rawalii TaxID=2055835 RepID=A0ABU2H681_9ACTN|nr:DUF2254 domain-containing protein [Lipingzhangella rawalii]MDS1270354.1 DUF2254 domain-containing protein [Lipingzhangella rawalii]